jgi:hypothetical protein
MLWLDFRLSEGARQDFPVPPRPPMSCLRLRCQFDLVLLEVANWRDVSGGCLDQDLAKAAKDQYYAPQKFEGIQRFTTVSGF